MAAVQSTSPGRESFFSDIALLINSLESEGYHFVRDAAVNNLMIGRISDRYPLQDIKDSEILERMPFSNEEGILDLLRDPMTVLVTVGTSLGLAMSRTLQQEYPDGQLVIIAGCSAFNGGYGGVSLYRWKKVITFNQGIRGDRVKIIRIYDGEVAA